MPVLEEVVGFHQDDGLRLEGELFLPGAAPSGSLAICAGFRGTRRGGAAAPLAERLAEELGWAVLLFDYSGFGGSQGRRGRFDPEQQVADVRSAVAYLRARFRHRPVSLYGNSFGAGMATVAAARESAVASLFSLCAFSSGAALMADQRPLWQLQAFEDALAADRLARAASGESGQVDPDWIMVRDPEATAYMATLGAAADRTPMTVADAERLCSFVPVAEASRLRGRPALFAHCERDNFVPAWHSRALAEAAGAQVLVLPGLGHYDVYRGEPQEALLRLALEFYRLAVPT